MASAAASEFTDELARLTTTGAQDDAIERLFTDSRAAEAANPDYYIAVANHYFAKSRRGVEVSTKPADPGDVSIRDPTTNEEVGSIADARPDPEVARLATAALSDAVERFPDRLDIRFGLAHLYHELDDFDDQFAVLSAAAAYAAEHGASLRWSAGADLPAPAEQYVPETLQAYAKQWFDRNTPDGDEHFLAIARLAVMRFPKHPYAYNSIASYWHVKKDLAKTRDYLAKAHELDPADQLIVYNLGALALESGDLAQARSLLASVIASDADDDVKDAAREKLAQADR